MAELTKVQLAQIGRLTAALHVCRQRARVYPAAHPHVRESIQEVMELLETILDTRDHVTLSIVEGELYVEGQLLPDESLTYKDMIADFTERELTCFTFLAGFTFGELTAFIAASDAKPEELRRLGGVKPALEQQGLRHITLDQWTLVLPETSSQEGVRISREVYRSAVEVVVAAFVDARARQRLNIEMVEGVVRVLVAGVLENQDICLGLSTLKSADEYTFYHSVNVAMLSMLMGSKLRLSGEILHKLGVAALLHDIGKVAVPDEILNKPGRLTDEEFQTVKSHTWEGVKALSEQDEVDKLALIVAAQHHAHYDLKGYPNFQGLGDLHFMSHLATVADVYDALTSERSYRRPMLPDRAMQIIIEGRGTTFHPSLTKVFASLTGMFPVGTLVELDSGEIGVVCTPHPDDIFRPQVKLVTKTPGTGTVFRQVDLSETASDGSYLRSIVKSADPRQYGIEIGQVV